MVYDHHNFNFNRVRMSAHNQLIQRVYTKLGLSIHRCVIRDRNKIGYIVDYGDLPTSLKCFELIRPNMSNSDADERDYAAICLLPDGFKMLGYFLRHVYIGEIVYNKDMQRFYRFYLYNAEAELVFTSKYEYTPSTAFRQVEAFITAETQKKNTNGRVMIGILFSGVQNVLRDYHFFHQTPTFDNSKLGQYYYQWLYNG